MKMKLQRIIGMQNILRTAATCMTELVFKRAIGKLDTESARAIYRPWSQNTIQNLGGKIIQEGVAPLEEPCLYVGNHMSYLDIPLLWAITECVFVSKESVRYWPIIGTAAMAVNTIFVSRDSKESRGKALNKIAEAIHEQKKRIAIFPEGTSSLEGKKWRYGAFRIAEEFKIPVQPFRLFYSPSRDASYIDQDLLLTQVWKLASHPKFEARIKFFDREMITHAETDCQRIQDMIQADQRDCLEQEKMGNH